MDVDKSIQRCSCVVGRTVWENHGFYSYTWYMTQAEIEILWRDPLKKRRGMCLFLDIVFLERKKGALFIVPPNGPVQYR